MQQRAEPTATWLPGGSTLLSLRDGILVEYDVETMAPIGVVLMWVTDGGKINRNRNEVGVWVVVVTVVMAVMALKTVAVKVLRFGNRVVSAG